jgi:transaldolase
VKKIYQYYKQHGHKTVIMAASFRTAESALELAGCDRLTMPPAVIEKISLMKDNFEVKLNEEFVKSESTEKLNIDEKSFRWLVNEEEIGNEKLADGIRAFARDAVKLEKIVKAKLI